MANFDDPVPQNRLDEWGFHSNWLLGLGSLGGKSTIDRITERSSKTPFIEKVEAGYDFSYERLRETNQSLDFQLSKLKRRLRIAQVIWHNEHNKFYIQSICIFAGGAPSRWLYILYNNVGP